MFWYFPSTNHQKRPFADVVIKATHRETPISKEIQIYAKSMNTEVFKVYV